MVHFCSITLFAVASAISPDPNTLLALSAGANVGALKSLPLLLGITFGFALMVLLMGLGMSHILITFPGLIYMVKVTGALYLIYLAWMIASNPLTGSHRAQSKPPGFLTGILFQWSNAKAWAVSLSAVTTFTSAGDQAVSQTAIVASIFLLAGIPCVGMWVLFGSMLRARLMPSLHLRRLNLVLGLMLLISVIPVLMEIG